VLVHAAAASRADALVHRAGEARLPRRNAT